MTTKPHGIVEDLGADIGYTATAALVDWFGGGNLCVPAEADESHPICRVIGSPAFKRLVGGYGGTVVWIPLGYQREMDRRDRLIALLLAQGNGSKTVAAVAGMSEKHVQQIRARLEEMGLMPLILRKAGMTGEGDSKFTPWRKRQPNAAKKTRGKRPY